MTLLFGFGIPATPTVPTLPNIMPGPPLPEIWLKLARCVPPTVLPLEAPVNEIPAPKFGTWTEPVELTPILLIATVLNCACVSPLLKEIPLPSPRGVMPKTPLPEIKFWVTVLNLAFPTVDRPIPSKTLGLAIWPLGSIPMLQF